MVKEGEKKDHVKHHDVDHVIHERKLRYYKKTVQLLTISLEVLFLFFVGAIIFLFLATNDSLLLQEENDGLIHQQQIIKNQLLASQEKAVLVSLSLPVTQLKDDMLIASFALPSGIPTNITVAMSSVLSQVQSGYQKRELVEEVNIPMHAKYAQTCFDFALYCATDTQDIVDLKNYYSSELTTLKNSGLKYVGVPLGDSTKYVMDFRSFVNPDGFEDELSVWFQERSSDKEFLEEVWYVVSQLTTYSEEITETPRFPLETILLGGGDCEDSAILFASMLKATQSDWRVSFFYTDLSHLTRPTKYDHVLIHVDTGVETFFIETTSKDEMSPYKAITGAYVLIN